MSGVGLCRVPEAPGDPVGHGLGRGPEFRGPAQPDGSLPQSAALPGAARGREVSSSAALHLNFSNSHPLHYYVHLTTGEKGRKYITVIYEEHVIKSLKPPFFLFFKQILYVTELPETAASHLHILRGPGSWLFVLACCAVQAGLCGWFVQEGPSLSEYMADMNITFVRAFLACPVIPLIGFALMQGFNGLMALISFMCTFMAVKPLHQYNLARDITFSSLIYCVLWVTFIPIYIGLKDKKNQSIVHISFCLASNLGLVAAYYFPKCYLLLRKPDLNIPKHFCTFLEGAPPRPAEEEPQPQPQSKSEQ